MNCNPPDFRFCPCCGGSLEKRRLNDHDRLFCRDCRRVLYINPAVGVAVVIRRGEEILWGRRASGAYGGAWCLPCGYVEWGEDVREAAAREFLEETGLKVGIGPVLAVHGISMTPSVSPWASGLPARWWPGCFSPVMILPRRPFFPWRPRRLPWPFPPTSWS